MNLSRRRDQKAFCTVTYIQAKSDKPVPIPTMAIIRTYRGVLSHLRIFPSPSRNLGT